MMKVGMIGLGIMGTAMARNLLNAGVPLTVWNREPERCAMFCALGAKVAASPAEVARACEVTFAMVADPEAARAVALGNQGVVSGMTGGIGPGKGYVDVSTVDDETAIEIGNAVRATGAQFLEAPVSGSKKPAEEGNLIFLAAGDKELYNKVVGLLDIMGKMALYLGETGNGARMKLVINMIMGSWMAGLSEGVALAEKSGLDLTVLQDVLENGVMASPLVKLKGPALIAEDYPPAFPLKHMQKDMRLALKLGVDTGQKLPIAGAANGKFLEAMGEGLMDFDFSVVHKVTK